MGVDKTEIRITLIDWESGSQVSSSGFNRYIN